MSTNQPDLIPGTLNTVNGHVWCYQDKTTGKLYRASNRASHFKQLKGDKFGNYILNSLPL